jgi:hypothetical protein
MKTFVFLKAMTFYKMSKTVDFTFASSEGRERDKEKYASQKRRLF